MAHWNDFMGPLIYTQSMEKKTLALGLYSFKDLYGTEYHLLMAAAIAVLLPVLVIFFSAPEVLRPGIVMSGIRGSRHPRPVVVPVLQGSATEDVPRVSSGTQ